MASASKIGASIDLCGTMRALPWADRKNLSGSKTKTEDAMVLRPERPVLSAQAEGLWIGVGLAKRRIFGGLHVDRFRFFS
jgi:hypothetical protein